jgi:bacillithiol biosynthesis cysteine-adding enzyme BshC
MGNKALHISYRDTGCFADLVLDYLEGAEAVKPFYRFTPDLKGIEASLKQRKDFPTNRQVLVQHLQHQYKVVDPSKMMEKQILSLGESNTFTITTAHQPNLFGGPLYLIYKIVHAIRLSQDLNKEFPTYHFVPVYYMGNEDADFEELNHCRILGSRYSWDTEQTGAFGKMQADNALLALIDQLAALLPVFPFGEDVIDLLRTSYNQGEAIEISTFRLMHQLFSKFGVVVLIADSKALKSLFASVVKDELLEKATENTVLPMIDLLKQKYTIQSNVRPLNLFYLKDGLRERIEKAGKEWRVLNTEIRFSEETLLQELQMHPERFSPNVLMRPLYQELILPNIVFVGGGGELSYWLELKKSFEYHQIPFPVLMLRQSFLLIKEETARRLSAFKFEMRDCFRPVDELLKQYVRQHSEMDLNLESESHQLQELYLQLAAKASAVDLTLEKHVYALQKQASKKLMALHKKMERADRRRFADEQRQIEKMKEECFPVGIMQERIDSVWNIYVNKGPSFIEQLIEESDPYNKKWKVLFVD